MGGMRALNLARLVVNPMTSSTHELGTPIEISLEPLAQPLVSRFQQAGLDIPRSPTLDVHGCAVDFPLREYTNDHARDIFWGVGGQARGIPCIFDTGDESRSRHPRTDGVCADGVRLGTHERAALTLSLVEGAMQMAFPRDPSRFGQTTYAFKLRMRPRTPCFDAMYT